MKRSTLAFTLALSGMGLTSGRAHADTLNFTINNATQVITPGGMVEYDATVSAPASNSGTLYLNADTFTVSTPLSLDDTAFLTDFPLSLAPDASYTGAIFDISVLPGTPAGTFQSSFQILGGATQDSQDVLGSQNFTTTVGSATVTPEPSSFILLGTGFVGVISSLRRRRQA